MPNSLSPAFVKIEYFSGFGPHSMIIPTLEYNVDDQLFDVWSGSPIAASDMIENLVTLMLPFFPNTVTFNNYSIFTQATATSDPVPVKSGALTAMVGSNVTPGWTKAVEQIITVRSTVGGICKLVFLDMASGNNYGKVVSLSGEVALNDLFEEWSGLSNGWSARDNGRPATFLQMTKTLNQKLREAYRET